MPSDAIPALSAFVSYKPSAFYFRRDLRAARDATTILAIVTTLLSEIKWCTEFGMAHGIEFEKRAQTETPNGIRGLREFGLTLCTELETVKQLIRDHDLIPPKRNIMRSEAVEKGWDVGA